MSGNFIFMRKNNSNVIKIAYTALRQIGGNVQIQVFRKNTDKPQNGEKTSKTIALQTVQKLLDIRKNIAVQMVTSAKLLWHVPESIITQNYEILTESKVLRNTIIKYPSLLGAQKPYNLQANITNIKSLPYDINQTVYLAVLEPMRLHKYLSNEEELVHRLDIFTRKLETTTDVVICGFVKRPFLLSINLSRTEEAIHILTANGVPAVDITQDWWVLLYKPSSIQERIDITRKHNISPIKTWMVRCTLEILDRYIQRRSDNKLILGDNTVVEYLSDRLNCTSDEAKGLMRRHPALQKKNMKRMEEIIDFLYAEGFQPYHICRVPKILLHSVQTMKKRLREFEKQGMRMDSLHLLTKSQKQYMQQYEALLKSNINQT